MRRLTLVTLFLLVALALAARAAPAGHGPELDAPLVVVRAYFDDPALVRELNWTEPWEVDYDQGYLVVEANPEQFGRLEEMGFRLEIDFALTAELTAPRQPLAGQGGGIPGYPCYRTVEETFASAEAIVAAYPQLASWIDVGDSWEKSIDPLDGFDIMVLVLTNAAIPGPKPATFINSAIHAREYTTAELNTRLAEYLVQNYGVDPDVTWMLDHQEVHLLLQSNPDGRKWAETGFLWRKNTNENYCSPTSANRGADLNRNFDFEWGCCGGSSTEECSLTYRGPSPASEPETQAVQDYMAAIFPDQREDDLTAAAPITATGVFIDLHSYSELVLWSWGFTFNPAPNGTGLQTLGRKLAYWNGYTPQQSIGLYPTDGTTKDYVYGRLGVPGYTFELGTAFFQSCDVFENTILPDNMPSLLYAIRASRMSYLTPAGPDALDVLAAPAVADPGQPVTLTATVDDTRYNNENGAEPIQNIVAAEYYIDTPPWVTATVPVPLPMTAADGSFNSPIEAVEAAVDTSGLVEGQHLIYVRGQDAAGNWGAIGAAFLLVGEPQAAFVSSSPDPLGATTVFTNTYHGPGMTFTWDFGDGSPASHEVHPTHVYAAAGVYTVTLTATHALGSDTATGVVEITPPVEIDYPLFLPAVLAQPPAAPRP